LGIGAWMIGVPLSMIIRNRPEDYGLLPDGETVTDNDFNVRREEPEANISFGQALKNRSFLLIVSAEWIRMMTVGTVITHVMPYLTSIGISRSMAGFISAGIPVCSMIGRFGFGWIGDYRDKRYMIAIGLGMMGLGLILFLNLKDSLVIVLVFLLTFAPGYGGGMSLRGAIIREYFGRAAFGKMVGLTMGVSSVAGIIGPTLGGWVFDTFDSYAPLWLGFAVLNLTGIVLILMVKPYQDEKWGEEQNNITEISGKIKKTG